MMHCWQDEYEWAGDQINEAVKRGDDYPDDLHMQWLRAAEEPRTCMLESGHEGPHEWTPSDQIKVRFE